MTMDADDTKEEILIARKTQAVLRHLRGEELDALSWELGVPKNRIAAWSRAFVHGGEVFLNHLDSEQPNPERTATLIKFGPGSAKRPSFSSARCFVPAEYKPAQRQLTLRSLPMLRSERVLDVRFDRVFYTEIMDLFTGITLAEPTSDELAGLERRCGQPADGAHFFFVLQTGILNPFQKSDKHPPRFTTRRVYVGAGALRIEETT
jgi:hypothetical protein